MKTPHKHAAMIKEWAEDTLQVVEYFTGTEWLLDHYHRWSPNVEYRIRHKHQDLIDQKAARPELIVEWRRANYGDWTICPTDLLFLLNEDIKYRLVEPRHKHQDLIDQKVARPELIIERKIFNGWTELDGEPMWHEQREYRLVEPRHKHQDLIDRKKERPELIVETKSDDAWVPIGEAVMWFKDSEYRLVEPPKKKVKMWQWLVQGSSAPILANSFYSSKEEAEHGLGRDVIQRADWTKILVDE